MLFELFCVMRDSDPIPVLLDCDPGIDDTLAVVYLAALHHAGKINLVGITTTAGNVDVEQTARNAAWVASLCGVDVPIAAGRKGPAARPLVTTPETHGQEGLGYVLPPSPQEGAYTAPEHGEAWREIWKNAHGAHLIVTGPVTNLADFTADADISLDPLHHFSQVTVMGGAVDYPGNTTETAEWNFWVDPEAADVLLRDYNATLCSLAVTEQFLVTPQRLEGILAALGQHPIRPYLGEILRFYFEFHEQQGQGYQAQIHDLLTCIIALGHCEVESRDIRARVALDGQRRGSVFFSEDATPTTLITKADIDSAHDVFLAALIGTEH